MLISTLTLCLMLVPQGPIEATAPDSGAGRARVIRHVPIRGLIARTMMPPVPRLGSLLGTEEPDQSAFSLLGDLESAQRLLDGDAVVELVVRAAPVATDECTLDVAGSSLVLSGPPDKVHLVEQTVREITGAVLQYVDLHAALYRIPARRELPATATREQLAAIVDGMDLLWSAGGPCRSGTTTGFSKSRETSYVVDVDVEVAQHSQIGDPVGGAYFEGIAVNLQPHVLTGSNDLVVYGQFAIGEERQPTILRSTGIKDLPSIDVPSLNSTSGAFSGRVPNGGALLVSLQGDTTGGSNLLLAVTASSRVHDRQDPGIYPVTAMLTNALSSSVRGTIVNSGHIPQLALNFGQDEGRRESPRDAGQLVELLRDGMGVDSEIDAVRGYIIATGSQEIRDGVKQVIGELQDKFLHTATIDCVTALTPAGPNPSFFAAATAGQSGELHHVTFPVLMGRPHVLIRGHETTTIGGINVEIAQKASVSNPVVDVIFSGLVTSVFVYRDLDGNGAEADLALIHVAEPRRRPAETKDGGDLYLPETSLARYAHTGPFDSGRRIDLGDGPTIRIDQQSYRTRQDIRITAR